MERLHIKTTKLVNPMSNETTFTFMISMNNTNYETGEPKVLQTYVRTAFENEEGFKECFFNGYYDHIKKDVILDTVFSCLNHPYKNDSFVPIYDRIMHDGPNGDIDGQYIDWNDIRASLIRCGLIDDKQIRPTIKKENNESI